MAAKHTQSGLPFSGSLIPKLSRHYRSSKVARFLGELPDPKMVIIRPGAWGKIAAVLAEMGYLSRYQDRRGERKLNNRRSNPSPVISAGFPGFLLPL